MIANILSTLGGGLAGYLYYRFIECGSGCPIADNFYISIFWGALIGYLFFKK